MSVRSKLKRWVTGISQTQEYICLGAAPEVQLRVWMELNGGITEVTRDHIFIGYKPILIGLTVPTAEPGMKVLFHFRTKKDDADIATLVTEVVYCQTLDDGQMALCQGLQGTHSFISPVHQWINQIRNRLSVKRPGNVNLPGNLYDQVRIAYAVPRVISMIVVTDGQLVNVFPTDLHGPAGNGYYVSSLRMHGKATRQVETLRRLLLVDLEAGQYREAYTRGANHQLPLQSKDAFDWQDHLSKVFSFPLPAGTIGYRELSLETSITRGIHRIHFYRVIHHEPSIGQPVAHVHQYYVQWMEDHGYPLRALLR